MSHKADKIMEDIAKLDAVEREDLFNQLVMRIEYGLAEFDDVEREMEKVENLEKEIEKLKKGEQ